MGRGSAILAPLLIGGVVIGVYMFRGCQEGPFGRKRVINMTQEQERQLGRQAFAQILRQEQSNLIDEGRQVEAVRRVGIRLARAAQNPDFLKAAGLKPMEFEWEFRVIRSRQINAFCLPGGKVAVYTAILPVCKNEAGLATVMGHEIGHALARHGAERIAQQELIQIGQTAAAFSLGNYDPATQRQLIGLLGAASQVGLTLPFSRKHESEADHLGVLLMATAGYDPAEAPEFWQRMERATTGNRPAEWLSTHPSPETRIKDLRGWQPQAEKLYDKAEKRGSPALPGR